MKIYKKIRRDTGCGSLTAEQAQQQFERDRAARESGERLGLSAASATQQAQSLAALGDRARAGDVQAAQLLEQIGKDAQATDQAGLDLAYEDFVRQEIFRESLTFLSSILRVFLYSHLQRHLSFNSIILLETC